MVVERARLRRLAWADATAVQALAAEALSARPSCSAAWRQPGAPPLCSPAGFDLVVGADVVYMAEAVPALFAAAAALLSASQEARCHGALRLSSGHAFFAARAAFSSLGWSLRWEDKVCSVRCQGQSLIAAVF